MNYEQTIKLVYNVACEFARRGPGWSQQSPVLNEIATRIRVRGDQQKEQLILRCWHDLFRLGLLDWGFNIDNPDAPFFHVPPADRQRLDFAGFPQFDPALLADRAGA